MTETSAAALTSLHRTAFSAAALRAAHHLRGREPKIFSDDLALALLDMDERAVLELAERVPPASAATCVLRSRYTEDRLRAAAGRVEQYVVLGAGLDTFGLRMGEALGALTVFEVDDPALQAWKKARIDAAGLHHPAQLRLVPCDFEQEQWSSALVKVGFDRTRPSFVSCLGVVQYLTREAVIGILEWTAALPPGSELVLSFVRPSPSVGTIAAALEKGGSPMLSLFEPHEMTALLERHGFSHVEHFGEAEANARFFDTRDDGLRAPANQCLVAALV